MMSSPRKQLIIIMKGNLKFSNSYNLNAIYTFLHGHHTHIPLVDNFLTHVQNLTLEMKPKWSLHRWRSWIFGRRVPSANIFWISLKAKQKPLTKMLYFFSLFVVATGLKEHQSLTILSSFALLWVPQSDLKLLIKKMDFGCDVEVNVHPLSSSLFSWFWKIRLW